MTAARSQTDGRITISGLLISRFKVRVLVGALNKSPYLKGFFHARTENAIRCAINSRGVGGWLPGLQKRVRGCRRICTCSWEATENRAICHQLPTILKQVFETTLRSDRGSSECLPPLVPNAAPFQGPAGFNLKLEVTHSHYLMAIMQARPGTVPFRRRTQQIRALPELRHFLP